MSSAALTMLRTELGRCPFHDFLRPVAVAAEADRVVVRLPSRPRFWGSRDADVLHGGVISSLVDMAGSAAVALASRGRATTIDLRVDFVRPASGPHFDARSWVVAGRSTVRADVEVTDAEGAVVALGRGTWKAHREHEVRGGRRCEQ